MERQCKSCLKAFAVDKYHRHQRYCREQKCQRERRNRWQREKLRDDADYRANQVDAQKRWLSKHPDYWKNYRAGHAEYVERNRMQQRQRRQCCSKRATVRHALDGVAKMDVADVQPHISTGIYRILPVTGEIVANMDVAKMQLIKIEEVALSG